MGKYSAARDLDLSIHIKWYVLANRVEAVFYREDEDRFVYVARMVNPKGHRLNSELESDRPGRVSSSAKGTSIRHSLEKKTNHHELQALKFGKGIANKLDKALREGKFTELVLVAEPHFLGLLRGQCSANVRAKITHSVPREFQQGSDKERRGLVMSAIHRMEK